jgi:hypothetical protein
MSPAISSGDSIIVGAACSGDLERSDIGVFASGTTLYAHRFMGWRCTEDGHPALEFCGDASAESDPLVGVDAVIGVVLEVEAREADAGRWRAPSGWREVWALASRVARAGYRALALTG